MTWRGTGRLGMPWGDAVLTVCAAFDIASGPSKGLNPVTPSGLDKRVAGRRREDEACP